MRAGPVRALVARAAQAFEATPCRSERALTCSPSGGLESVGLDLWFATRIVLGKVVERDGFVFADLLPVGPSPAVPGHYRQDQFHRFSRTKTTTVRESLSPSSSVTVTLAAYRPGSMYSWQVWAVEAVPRPSPKSHSMSKGFRCGW